MTVTTRCGPQVKTISPAYVKAMGQSILSATTDSHPCKNCTVGYCTRGAIPHSLPPEYRLLAERLTCLVCWVNGQYIQTQICHVVSVILQKARDLLWPCLEMFNYYDRQGAPYDSLRTFQHFALHSLDVYFEKVETIECQRVDRNGVH